MRTSTPNPAVRSSAGRLLRRLAVAATGLLAAPAFADPPPAPPEPVHIEQWRGIRRIDVPPAPAAAVGSPAESADDGAPVVPSVGPRLLPFNLGTETEAVIPAAGGPEAAAPTGGVVPAQLTVPTNEPADGPAKESLPAPSRAAADGGRTPGGPYPPPRAESATPDPVRPPRAPVVGGTDGPADGFGLTTPALLQAACVFAAAFLGPLFAVAFLLVVLRRGGRNGGPLVRIEYVGGVPFVPAGPQAAGDRPADYGGRVGAALDPTAARAVAEWENAIGEPFELGPTYAEERVRNEAMARQQEAGVLQALFEENLRLREQIDAAPPDDPPPGTGGTGAAAHE